MAQTGVAGALNGGGDGYGATGERVSRRKRLAGYLKAANELRQSYQNAYMPQEETDREVEEDEAGIPGAFPELKVARSGIEEMVLFPSYARRHTRKERHATPAPHPPGVTEDLQGNSSTGDAEYWRKEWEMYEDANAVVDVDVRGWIYSPHSGPMTRKNRLLFGIARHLSGIPAPVTASQSTSRASSRHRDRATEHEEEMAEREAQAITERGRQEADIAGRGGYSERPDRTYDRSNSYSQDEESRSSSPRPGNIARPLTDSSLEPGQAGVAGLVKRSSWNQPADMSPAELVIANKHLMTRLKPFLTNPSMNIPLTIFFYNGETSQSRTTHTNEAGHFNFRAALDFVPTHVRILAGENLSATEEVRITEPRGISLISDIDDTIKHSAIGSGAKEIFRNTFIRDLSDLTIEGVKEWYTKLSDMGVKLHYVSNAPWQLYPVLVSYFARAGLPPGSFHLKQYSGMLQGIFEPVAERKKGTLDRIMQDFPERRFILVGDSGEADLELYTDVVLSNPGRVLAIFIRDVTTAPNQSFFDPSMGPLSGGGSRSPFGGQTTKTTSNGTSASRSPMQRGDNRPPLPTRPFTERPIQNAQQLSGPRMGMLIDFDDESDYSMPPSPLRTASSDLAEHRPAAPTKRPPPTRPSKPIALRSVSSESSITLASSKAPPSTRKSPVPPPKPRKYSVSQDANQTAERSPLVKIQNASPSGSRASSEERRSYRSVVKDKVASAYGALPSPTAYWHGTSSNASSPRKDDRSRSIAHTPLENAAPPVPPRKNVTSYPMAAAQYATSRLGFSGEEEASAASPLNKKEELWKRRWTRAKEVLDEKGVMLRAWRVGYDVMDEAVRLVEKVQEKDRA
jgi:phosphatidate phosphatase APP1